MHRFHVLLDDDLYGALSRRAISDGRAKASIAREALRQTLRAELLPPIEEDPIWEMVGSSDAEPVEGIDEYLVQLKETKTS